MAYFDVLALIVALIGAILWLLLIVAAFAAPIVLNFFLKDEGYLPRKWYVLLIAYPVGWLVILPFVIGLYPAMGDLMEWGGFYPETY